MSDPKIDWEGDESAPGRAVRIGSGKWRVASTTARAELWIPVSIAVVLQTASE
eukprot:CAMPEP_0179455586 /NCGR_PEP_ID=MMETSP0799-20121207/39512_1 /TAXON_ID=46947 /ORGANISM="Geminigera cryophila, Strain CCMP2564" /LENGTH=52 /DNA_ID=CAMNT_0021254737 /DNA_START=250 /DNA_END=408 /DNA_ORIENTATION=-